MNSNNSLNDSSKPFFEDTETLSDAQDDNQETITPDEILERRAQILAKPVRIQNEESEIVIVQFILSEQIYAFEIAYVKEALQLRDVTPLPSTPDYYVGVINIRGKYLVVVDLCKLLGLPDHSAQVFNKVVVIEHEQVRIGVLADEVLGASSFSTSAIEKNVSGLTKQSADFVVGITDDKTIILNASSIISDERLKIDQVQGEL